MKKTISLALNQITKQSISCYWGPLDLGDSIYELVKEDFEYAFKEAGWEDYAKIKGKKVKLDDLDYDFEYIDNLDEYEAGIFKDKIFEHIPDFDKRLEKYGLSFIDISIWKPKYYNYNDDELSIQFEFDEDGKIEDELKPIIEDYIENIRIKSYDGYCSFEPSNIDEVDKSDYCYFYAVLQKEGIYEDVKEAINDAIGDMLGEYYELYQNPRLYYDGKYYKIEWKGDNCKLIEAK